MIEDLINRNLSREVTFYWGGRCPADLYMADLARK
jgi:NAD(P)H-flavin reductase